MNELVPVRARIFWLALGSLAMAGCSSLGGSGPSGRSIRDVAQTAAVDAPLQVIPYVPEVGVRLAQLSDKRTFANTLGDAAVVQSVFGAGDTLAISIYEAPPAVLFGPNATVGTGRSTSSAPGSASPGTSLPPIVVDEEGLISLPFVGTVRAAGRTPQELQNAIKQRLRGIANDPQVLVGLQQNVSRTVTVIGETGVNLRAPVSPQGERLLEILASAQSLNQPVDKTTVQVTRGDLSVRMPLRSVISDPAQNIRLQAGDIVTALYKTNSFSALGAVANSSEVEFEATGISLAQALGRVGGLDPQRADVRGLFVFRFEDPAVLSPEAAARLPRDPEGRVAVIYTFDMNEPESLFRIQQFTMRDSDVLYVSEAPLTDLQQFVGVVSQLVFTVINIGAGVTSF